MSQKLAAEEQLLLKDIFWIKVYDENLTDYKADLMFLPGFAKDLSLVPGQNISLVENSTLFDTLLMERLSIQGTKILIYLDDCFQRASEEKGKSWNLEQKYQNFINYSEQIIQNFAHLALTNPDMFPNQHTEDTIEKEPDLSKQITMKLERLIQYRFDDCFMLPIIDKFETTEQEAIRKHLLTWMLTEHKSMQVSEQKATTNIEMLYKLLQDDRFKHQLFTLDEYPWIPGPNKIALKKAFGSAMGNAMENFSPLGIILKPSFLPPLIEVQKDKEMHEKLLEKISEMTKKDRKQASIQQALYQQALNQYIKVVAEIFKLLLKPTKDTTINYKIETMKWLSALIVGNSSRVKLGSRLDQENKKLRHYSSDGLCLNAFDLMLEICSKFLDKNSPMLDKIDPQYYINGWKFEFSETPMINKSGIIVEETIFEKKSSEEFGTITEFFFHCVEFAHFLMIPTILNCVEVRQIIQKIKSELEKMDPNSQIAKQLEKDRKYQENIFLSYHCILMDQNRMTKSMNMYDVLLHLLLKWSNIKPNEIKNGKIPTYKAKALLKYLPEHWITDFFEYHFFYLRIKEGYAKNLCNANNSSHMMNLLTFLTILLTDIDFISNPYTKAKIVELVSFFCYDNKDIIGIFDQNEIAVQHLMRGLVKFYIDIEFTGASNQFYAKYEYRHYTSSIFKKLWKLKQYQKSLVDISQTELFERFVNMIMNDITYCMDESLQKLFKILEFQSMKEQGKALTPEDEKTLEQYEGMCRTFFLQVRENLKMITSISTWAPHAFFFGDFRKRISAMLNYFICELVSPKLINLKLGKNKDYKFKQKSLLRDIIHTYVNLSNDEEFCRCVTKDERSFNLDCMAKAAKKAQTNHNISEDQLEKFEIFLNGLQQISKENVDLTEKLGDIPDEFMCPISCDLMKDPVFLPTSGNVMEKSVIKQILLNDEHDPFNRAPLKFSDVQDRLDIKQKIEAWIKKKLSGELMEEEKPKVQFIKDKDQIEEEKAPENGESQEYDPFRWNDKKFF